LKLEIPAKSFLDLLMFEGLEHHVSLVYGNYLNEIKAFAKLVGIPVLDMSKEVIG
jgi:L-fucose isomerase-like protein